MTSSRERKRGSSKKSVSKRIGEESSESSDNEAGTGGGDTCRAQPSEESENDCPVYNDEDFTVEGGDEDCALVVVGDPVGGGDNDDNDDNEGGLGAVNSNIADDFPEAAIEDQAGNDSDSGDDIWDDDKIPDPLSSDDEDELEDENRDRVEDVDDPEVFLALEKTYNSSDEFKLAVLRYSMKKRYDIKLYKSEAMMVGAKCCYVGDDGVSCPWRVYWSYEKRKHKMQIRVYINEHICVRSGRTKMLKRSAIALLFEERLRLNPKLTRYDMADEIKREYNLEVTPDQCGKAKTKVLSARKASHESHFGRIWDYHAEIFKQNKDSEFEIETVPGPVIVS